MDLSSEQWLPVVGYEGIYEVSNHGRVKRVKAATGATVGLILKWFESAGYQQVCLYRKGIKKYFKTHNLVWIAFKGPVPPGLELNHMDGIKTNSRLNNLEAITKSENMRHAVRIGLRNSIPIVVHGERNGRSKLTEADIVAIRTGTRYPGYNAAMSKKYGVSRSTISRVTEHHNWNHVTGK